MAETFLDLKNTTIFIRDANNNIVAHCFIVTFRGDKDNKSTRPFLVTSSCNKLPLGSYIDLPVIDSSGGKTSYHQIIVNDFITNLNDDGVNVLVMPMAFVYNSIIPNGYAIDFKTIPEELIVNDSFINKLSIYENVCTFNYNDDFKEVAFYKKDSLSEVKNTEVFYISKQGIRYLGSAVYIFSQSTYVENNSINIGSRLFLIGIAVESIGEVIKVQSMKKVVELIKKTFKFDTNFEEDKSNDGK